MDIFGCHACLVSYRCKKEPNKGRFFEDVYFDRVMTHVICSYGKKTWEKKLFMMLEMKMGAIWMSYKPWDIWKSGKSTMYHERILQCDQHKYLLALIQQSLPPRSTSIHHFKYLYTTFQVFSIHLFLDIKTTSKY